MATKCEWANWAWKVFSWMQESLYGEWKRNPASMQWKAETSNFTTKWIRWSKWYWWIQRNSDWKGCKGAQWGNFLSGKKKKRKVDLCTFVKIIARSYCARYLQNKILYTLKYTYSIGSQIILGKKWRLLKSTFSFTETLMGEHPKWEFIKKTKQKKYIKLLVNQPLKMITRQKNCNTSVFQIRHTSTQGSHFYMHHFRKYGAHWKEVIISFIWGHHGLDQAGGILTMTQQMLGTNVKVSSSPINFSNWIHCQT